MAVTFEAGSTAIGASGLGTTDTSALSITLTAAANSLLLIGMTFTGDPGAITSVTWNGAAMTQVGATYSGDAATYIAIFGILNPASGTGTYAATWTNSVNCIRSAEQFGGVLQTNVALACPHIATNTGAASPGTATVTSVNGDGAFWVGVTASTVAWTNTITGGTFDKESTAGTTIDGQFAHGFPSGVSTTISGTLFNAGNWNVVLVDIAQAAGGGITPHNFSLLGVGP